LRRPPRDRSRARQWLGTVVRNLVRNHRRSWLRRQRLADESREDAPPVPSADTLAERLEAHRGLVQAVAQLTEPYRQVVLLRYYEGFSAADIARRLRVPAGTIRWRLKTALEQLRAALDAACGDRQRWMLALAPLAQAARVGTAGPGMAPAEIGEAGREPDVASASSGVTPARLLASRAGRSLLGLLAAAAAVLAVAGCVVVWLSLGRGVGSARAKAESASDRPSGRARPPRLAGLGLSAAGGSPASTDTAIPAWAQVELAPAAVVAGRVVSGRRPVEGARLRLSSGMLSFARRFDRQAVSDGSGAFTFSQQAPTNWFLTVSAKGLEPAILYLDLREPRPRSLPGGQPAEALVIDLRPCQIFTRGVVKDNAGGALPNARVRLAASWNNGGTEVQADGSGHYEICLPRPTSPVGHILVATADGYGAVETLAPIDDSRIDFALEPQALVAGRAVRDADGEPLGGVNVTLLPVAPADPNHPPAGTFQAVRLGATADEQGRFEITGLSEGRYKLNFAHDEIASSEARFVTVKSGQVLRGIEVRLRPVAMVEGHVKRAGAPAAHARLFFKRRDASNRWEDAGWTMADQDGRFRVRLEKGVAVERILSPYDTGAGACTVALTPRLVAGESREEGLVIELPPMPAVLDPASAVTRSGAAAPRPLVSREARFGDRVQVLGYDLSSTRVSRGGQLEVTVYFQVLDDLTGWHLFTHLGGAGGFRNLDHIPVGGAYPVERWRKGETIRDRFTLNIDSSFPAGEYTWLLGFWNGGTRRLPVTPASHQDGDSRFLAFTFTVM
jgi:hypothetical protein